MQRVKEEEKVLQLLALCPFFQHLRQSPSRKHLALSVGVSLEMVIASTSMALGSFCGRGVKEVWGRPPLSASILIF